MAGIYKGSLTDACQLQYYVCVRTLSAKLFLSGIIKNIIKNNAFYIYIIWGGGGGGGEG